MADAPVVMAVFLQYVEGARTVGVAYCDAAGRKLGACEFTDDEQFCNLEAVLVQLGAKECVLPKVCSPCGGRAGVSVLLCFLAVKCCCQCSLCLF